MLTNRLLKLLAISCSIILLLIGFAVAISSYAHLAYIVQLSSTFIFSLLMGIALCSALTAVARNKQLGEKSTALTASERRQQQIVDKVEDYAIFWLDLKGNVETWNYGAERIFGYNEDEIQEKNYAIFFIAEDQRTGLPQKALDIALKSGKFRQEGWLRHKNKTKFWASLMAEIVLNDTGYLSGFVIFVRNIDDKRKLELERDRLIHTIDESPDFIGMADMGGHLLYHNRAAKRMVGLSLEHDMSGMTISNMHPKSEFKRLEEDIFPEVLKNGHWSGETLLLNHKNGEEIPVLQTITLHKDERNKPSYLTTIMRDITERKKAEEALKTSEELLRSTMEYAAVGMALISLNGHWLKLNKALCIIFGYTEKELFALDFQILTHPDDLKIDLKYIEQLLEGEIESYQMEKRYLHKTGVYVWVLLSVTLLRDAQNNPMYFIAQLQNIDRLKQIEQELKYMAYHDVLTGLSNRKQLESSFELALALAKRHKSYIAIMFLDIDHFKDINDYYGHDAGDLLLREVASRLQTCVREPDVLVRLGGDEFIIAITELPQMNHVVDIAKKLVAAVRRPMKIKQHQFNITMSIGISIYPQDGEDLTTLVKNADKALYQVKMEGRNNFKLFSS